MISRNELIIVCLMCLFLLIYLLAYLEYEYIMKIYISD